MLVNRAIRPKIATGRPSAALFWTATAALVLAPLVVSGVFDLTMLEMLGRGPIW